MEILSKRFFFDIMLNPYGSNGLNPQEQRRALVTSIMIGILSLGLVHAVCAIIAYSGRISPGQQTPKMAAIQQRHFGTPNPDSSNSLKSQFDRLIDSSMGKHIRPNQKQKLLELFDQAMQNPQPKAALEHLIDSQVPSVWGADKAAHIKKNLLPLMPVGDGTSTPTLSAQTNLLAQVQSIASQNEFVGFYKTGPTEFLGNFAICPNGLSIQVNNQTFSFRCSEAAFQWFKYYQTAMEHPNRGILQDPNLSKFYTCDGEEAFKLRKYFDKQYPGIFPKNWKKGQRDSAMWTILQAKFQQNPEFIQLLSATRTCYLLEHNQVTGRDKYWSDDNDGTGHNMLGKMLMAIRDNKPCPRVENETHVMDNSDLAKTRKYANQANHGLSYNIF
jgi:hypothetical protein